MALLPASDTQQVLKVPTAQSSLGLGLWSHKETNRASSCDLGSPGGCGYRGRGFGDAGAGTGGVQGGGGVQQGSMGAVWGRKCKEGLWVQ